MYVASSTMQSRSTAAPRDSETVGYQGSGD
jgi:hypothetical protein